MAVHILGKDDGELARLFGGQSGAEADKFAQREWRPGPDGVPVLAAAPAWCRGRILERMRLRDHVAFLIEPDSGECGDEVGDFITYAEVRDLEPGHGA